MFTNAIVWTHAGAGAIWIAACACFVIAGLAIEDGTDEQASFVRRAIARINQVALAAASVVLITGAINLAIVTAARGSNLRAIFVFVVLAKLAIFAVMATALALAMRASARTRGLLQSGNRGALPGAIRRMVRAHFTMVALGSIALVLGLWLAGS